MKKNAKPGVNTSTKTNPEGAFRNHNIPDNFKSLKTVHKLWP
jgi:hypothetical protein